MDAPPKVPERTSSLKQKLSSILPARVRTEGRQELKRKLSKLEQVTAQTSGVEIIAAKLEALEGQKQWAELILDHARQKNRPAEEIVELQKQIAAFTHEMALASREQHLLAQDLDEMASVKQNLVQDWVENLVHRVFSARAYTPRMLKNAKFDQARYSRAVLDYLHAKNAGGRKWCHISAEWFEGGQVKCAHLVPKSLQETTCSKLFGASMDVRYDQRNGITLRAQLEEALDEGKMVIVPKSTNNTVWQCLILDEDFANKFQSGGQSGPMWKVRHIHWLSWSIC